MAASTSTLADRPQLVDKADAQSKIWHYFGYIDDSQDKPTDTTKPICKRCFKPMQAKRANMSKLAKHVTVRHAEGIQRVTS